MLEEVYFLLFVVASLLMVLSFIPLGEKRRLYRRSGDDEENLEVQNFVILFPWVSMGIFFFLGIASMDMVSLHCGTVTDSINTTVGNFSNYSSSWSCYEYHHFDEGAAWLCNALGIIMFVYAVLATFFWSLGNLAKQIGKVSR